MASLKKNSFNLKDPHVCRIFFSSPFNGMEGERQDLTKIYWPQIESLCNSKGLQFVPVDMRWGITTDHADASLTISICLREIDRSDLFVGFFGQRYGWHGKEDEALQQNFDMAVGKYPWLNGVRDKSVTELEFLHGHLNQPGKLPACICFRDKAFDKKMLEKAKEEDDKRGIRKYSPESDHSISEMDDLKARVLESETKTLGVLMDYKNPAEGAKFMFDCIWKYLNEELFSSDVKKTVISPGQQESLHHEIFCQRMGLGYLGGESYLSQLDAFISEDSNRGMVVHGPAGSGKSALLSNWIQRLEGMKSEDHVLFYHFVGCSSDSSAVNKCLVRALSHLSESINSHVTVANLIKQKEQELVTELTTLMRKCVAARKRITLVIDGLESFNNAGKISIPLYWLPRDIPSGVHVVLACQDTHKVSMKELLEVRGYRALGITPLETDIIQKLCQERLMLRGKELSLGQTETVINAPSTKNPLFLSIVLEELCMFGSFRQLDAKIASLTQCTSCQDLFLEYLQRLEEDFNTEDMPDLVQKVMSALCVTRHGLSETDITNMFLIPSHIWSPLFYNLEKYLFDRSGYLRIIHRDLELAASGRYFTTPDDRSKTIVCLKDWMVKSIKTDALSDLPDFYPLEVAWLAQQTGNRVELLNIISTLPIFTALLRSDPYTLLEFLYTCDISEERLIQVYNDSINKQVVTVYAALEDQYLEREPDVSTELMNHLNNMDLLLDFSKHHKAKEFFLERSIHVLQVNKRMDETNRVHRLTDCQYKLACLYADTNLDQKSYDLHLKVMQQLEGRKEKTEEEHVLLGHCYHGAGIPLVRLQRLDEAAAMFHKSIESHEHIPHHVDNKKNSCKSLFMLAEIEALKGDDNKAVQLYEQVHKMEEEVYFGSLPLEMAYSLTNLGNCYRRLKEMDKAEKALLRALEIKKNAVGRKHHDTAAGNVALGNFYWANDNEIQVEKCLKEAIDIFNVIGHGENDDAIKAKENLLWLMVSQHARGTPRMGEVEDIYWQVFNSLRERGRLDHCIKPVHENYIRLFSSRKEYDKVMRIATAFVYAETATAPMHYFNIHMIDLEDDVNNAPTERPPRERLDTGIARFPEDRSLAMLKIEKILIPKEDSSACISVIDNLIPNISPVDAEGFVVHTAKLCLSKQWVLGALIVLDNYLPKYPESESILDLAGSIHLGEKQYPQALGYLQRLSNLSSPQPDQMLRLIQCAMLSSDVEAAEEAIRRMEATWPDDPQVAEKVKVSRGLLQETRQYLDSQKQPTEVTSNEDES